MRKNRLSSVFVIFGALLQLTLGHQQTLQEFERESIEKCGEGWDKVGKACFKLQTTSLTHDEAEKACRAEGAELASILDKEEEDFVKDNYNPPANGMYIGLTDLSKSTKKGMGNSRRWAWSDGSPVKFTSWWMMGEPNNQKGNEWCVIILPPLMHQWFDYVCDEKLPSICKRGGGPRPTTPAPTKPPTTTTTQKVTTLAPTEAMTTAAPTVGRCGAGWDNVGDACFKQQTKPLSQEEASAACKQQGGTLASISSKEEQEFLKNNYKAGSNEMYIGLTDVSKQNIPGKGPLRDWRWEDKSKLDFTAWLKKEPDNVDGKEWCVVVAKNKDFGWFDSKCSEKKASICKKNAVKAKEAECRVTGDPHYATFDGYKHDFQGKCEYVLTADCAGDSWKILTKNEPWVPGAKVTGVFQVTVKLGNDTNIVIDRNDFRIGAKERVKKVKVNGKEVDLPFSGKDDEFKITKQGRAVQVETNIGVKISYDQYHFVSVILSDKWYNKTCGLCGVWNDDKADEKAMDESPKTMQDKNLAGKDACEEPPPPPQCSSETAKKQAEKKCKKRLQETECKEVKYENFLHDCILDVCTCGETCLCDNLMAYTQECFRATNDKKYAKDPCKKVEEGDVTAHCTARGGPTYRTFDDLHYTFRGICWYVLAKDCADSWQVQVHTIPSFKGSTRPKIDTSRVVLKDNKIEVNYEDKSIKVNGKKIDLPYNSTGYTIEAKKDTGLITLDAMESNGFKAKFNGKGVQVVVKERWVSKTCGLCGKWNMLLADDKKLEDSKYANTMAVAGEKCTLPEKTECTKLKKDKAEKKCKVLYRLSASPDCDEAIIDDLFDDCVNDMCTCGDKCLCGIIEEAASQCAEASGSKNFMTKWKGLVKVCNVFTIATKPPITKQPVKVGECGVKPKQQGKRIVGGKESEEHSHPWTVHFEIQHNLGPSRCAGTVIDKQWVLSTAQCFLTGMMIYGTPYNLVKVKALFGKHNIHKKETGEVSMDIPLKNIIQHDVFHQEVHKQYKRHNIALIKLPQPLTFSPTIQPICLPKSWERTKNFKDSPLTIVGWGTLKNRQQTSLLQEASAEIIDLATCEKLYKGIDEHVMCTQKKTISTCVGDGGGSIEYKRKNGVYTLVGMNSFSKIEWDGKCFEGQVGGAVFIPVFRDWIEKTAGKKFP